MVNKFLKTVTISVILFSLLLSQDNFSLSKGQDIYKFDKNSNNEYIGNLNNCAVLGKNENQKVSSSIFYQNYSWEGWSFSQRGLKINYINKGLGISANIIGKGSWDEMVCTDEYGNNKGKYNDIFQERFITISYAKQMLNLFYIGISGKYLNTSYPGEIKIINDKNGAAIDFGMLYQIFNNFEVGLNVQNILSTKIDYIIYDNFGSWAFPNELPINVNISCLYSLTSKIKLNFDIENIFEDSVYEPNHKTDYIFKKSYRLGCNWNIYENLFLNIGYKNFSRPTNFNSTENQKKFNYNLYNSYTLGIHYKLKKYEIDASVNNDNRKEKMEKYPINLDNNTFLYHVALSYEL